MPGAVETPQLSRPAEPGPSGSRTARCLHRQRRPSGAPPPLPRGIGGSGKIWLAAAIVIFVAAVAGLRTQAGLTFCDSIDTWFLARLASIRTPWLTHLMRGVKAFGSGWTITVLGLGTVALLMVFRRWRHLLVLFGCSFLLGQLGGIMLEVLDRPRPYGVTIISGWGGFSMPSPPVATMALLLVAIAFTLLPHGRWRNLADAMMMFQQRSELVSFVARTENRRLCGVGATCPDR